MIFNRSLAAAAIVLANVVNAEFVFTEECHELYLKGENLVNSPGCRLVKALTLRAPFEEDDIMGMDMDEEDIQGVCTAKPSCVEDLSSLISKHDAIGCNPRAAAEAGDTTWWRAIGSIRYWYTELSIITEYFCENDCNAVTTKAVVDGDESAATCECLLSYVAVARISLDLDTRIYLGLDSEVDSKINSAIAEKKCIANNLRLPATNS